MDTTCSRNIYWKSY